jgi:calcineurin-like phosphoesterase family protein
MRFYLAARYDRLHEMQAYRSLLEDLGHEVTSRWVNGNHDMDSDGYPEDFAYEDWDDIDASDCLIFFSEDPTAGFMRGGRHVEFGIALSEDKLLVLIGEPENVFHYFPWIFRFNRFEDFLDTLKHGGLDRYIAMERLDYEDSNR